MVDTLAMSNENRSMMVARNVLGGVGVVLGIMAGSGCGSLTKPNPLSCLDGYCSDQAHPFCDVDGSFSGKPGLCVAVDCEPLAFEACRGDEAIVCNATGDDYDITHCDFGCGDDAHGCKQCTPGTPGCDVHIIPKYLPTVCDSPAVDNELTISESKLLDTNTDANCNGGIVEQRVDGQAVGPPICVIRYRSIAVATNKTLTVTGGRALALVADDLLAVNGTLDVSANGAVSGPGRFSSSDVTPVEWPSGQGGAGFHTAGSPGGSVDVDGGAANGGGAKMNPALLEYLVPGTRSTTTGFSIVEPGGAGGAATLVSCRGEVSVVGLIDAGGGGGSGGTTLDTTAGIIAGGGGAGGNLVLQGMRVSVTGQVFANGGGGGAGGPGGGSGTKGAAGADGTRSTTESAQGGTGQAGEGSGGSGGRIGSEPTAGKKPSSTSGAGAGGGSTGFLQTYTPAGTAPEIAPAAASPAFETNRTVPTR